MTFSEINSWMDIITTTCRSRGYGADGLLKAECMASIQRALPNGKTAALDAIEETIRAWEILT